MNSRLLLCVLAVLFVFGSCYNPFFPEKKEKGQGPDSNPDPGSDPIPTYGISLSSSDTPISSHNFGSVEISYSAQEPKEITIVNTGNQPTGSLTVALSGANAGSFTLSQTVISSIAVSGSAYFTVAPNLGLNDSTYSATVTVSGGNAILATLDVSFEVTDPGSGTDPDPVNQLFVITIAEITDINEPSNTDVLIFLIGDPSTATFTITDDDADEYEIEWWYGDGELGTGPELIINAAQFGVIGKMFITVYVTIGDMTYSREIEFEVGVQDEN